MSVKKFRFVSPGVFINEIDNSQIPKEAAGVGPVVIGRSRRGPAMVPVQVDNFLEFIEIFGNPSAGGEGGDVWRDGNYTAPTYAAYAAQAWLKNSAPLTFVRLLGTQHKHATTGGHAGWETTNEPISNTGLLTDSGGAYGLFIAEKPTGTSGDLTLIKDAALAAIIYVDEGTVGLVGAEPDGAGTFTAALAPTGRWIGSNGNDAEFKLAIKNKDSVDEEFVVNFNRTSKKFIRNKMNTNPTLSNDLTVSDKQVKDYWVGETFESHLENLVTTSGDTIGVIVALTGANANFDKHSMRLGAQSAATPWIFSQSTLNYNSFKVVGNDGAELNGVTNLFRFYALSEGEWASSNLKISITDIKASDTEFNKYGTFTVVVRSTSDTDNTPAYIERFTNCNLNPASNDYVARKIGDMKATWDYKESRYKTEGQYLNVSKFIRIFVNDDLDAELLPMGFYGPAAPRPVTVVHTEATPPIVAPASDSSGAFLSNTANIAISVAAKNGGIDGQSPGGLVTDATLTLHFPAMRCRNTSSEDNLGSGTKSYFGVTSSQTTSKKDESYADFCRPYSGLFSAGEAFNDAGSNPAALPQLYSSKGSFSGDQFTTANAASVKTACGDFYGNGIVPYFSLEDLVMTDIPMGGGIYTKSEEHVEWIPGSRFAGAAISARGNNPATYTATAQASVTVTVLATFDAGDEITITDSLDNDVTYIVAESNTFHGESTGAGAARKIIVGIGLAADPTLTVETKASRFAHAINSTSEADNGETLHVTAVVDGIDIILTQDYGGVGGNSAGVGANGDITETATTPALTIPVDKFVGGANNVVTHPGTHKDVLDHGYDRFTVPMIGGFDGLNIKEKEPFRNGVLSVDGGETTNYAYNSVIRAINSVADPEVVEMNLATIPGIHNAGITNHLLSTCENRADALAIIDLKGDYTPNTEGVQDESLRLPDVDQAIANLKGRGINSSYGCAYFPWVQIRDTISDSVLWAPPSVVALGTMASSERKSEVWFAPAGFNRGGLTEGSAGLPVTQVRRRLTSRDRDKLYEANINPIASFPSEGLVIFGQKTLQVTPSALDRINVRRLMIFVKKQISRYAAQLIFEQNLEGTWNRFTGQVEPFLASVKSRFGLSDFRVVLDETTTTPDLIDRNIMYAKIMLKPARAIEFIAIDFVITNTGASFDD